VIAFVTVGAAVRVLDDLGLADGPEERKRDEAECERTPSADEQFAALSKRLVVDRPTAAEQKVLDDQLAGRKLPDGVTFSLRYIALPDDSFGSVRIMAGVPERFRDELFDEIENRGEERGFRDVRDTLVGAEKAKAMEITPPDGNESTQVVAWSGCSVFYTVTEDERTAVTLTKAVLAK
jgi:hypothetical protein